MKKTTICILSAILMSSITLVDAQKTKNKPSDSTSKKVKDLEEIVLVGFGKQKKGTVSGSIASVDKKILQDRPTTSLTASLQGALPGVTIKSSLGDVGSVPTLNVRGRSVAGNSPLYIIDGIPSSAADFSRLSPADIENISILKDASASIYGARAGYGVVLVETKKGGGGKMSIGYNMYNGYQTPTYLPKYVDAVEYMKLKNEAYYNANNNVGHFSQYTQDQINLTAAGTDTDRYPNTDWYKATYRRMANVLNNEINISGGDKTRYFASLGYLKQESLSPTKGMDRYSFRTNTSSKLSDKLTVNSNISFIKQMINDQGGVINTGELARITPTMVLRQSNGWWGSVNAGKVDNTFANTNPVRNNVEGGDSKSNDQKFMGALSANYTPVKGLNVNAQINYSNWNYRLGTFVNTLNPVYNFLTNVPISSTARAINNYSESWNSDELLNTQVLISYEKNISSHYFKLLGGTSYEDYTTRSISGKKSNIPKDGLHSLSALSTLDGTLDELNSNTQQYAFQSVFARINYNYQEKYFLEGIIRADASSRFAKENRWGYFPAIMASWRLDKENFIKNLSFINTLKLRGSYGSTGSINTIGYYDNQTYMDNTSTVLGNTIVGGVVPGKLGFLGIGWETIVTKNIGLDGSLFNNAFTFSVDLYNRLTKGALMSNQLEYETGVAENQAPPINAGNVENKGIEITLGYNKNFENGDFYINANFAKNRNNILSLINSKTLYNDYWITQVGGSIGDFYGYKTAGLLTQEDINNNYPKLYSSSQVGDIKYVDINGDGVVDEKDRTVIGNDVPSLTYGLSIGGRYKNFDLSVVGQGVANVKVYLDKESSQAFFNGAGAKQYVSDNRWTPENPNPNALYPRILPSGGGTQNIGVISDYWLFDASYFRIKSITLGYSIPKETISRIGLTKFRIYANLENYFTLRGDKRMKDFDPEMPSSRSTYPYLKTISFGINATF
ncbi:SusC/RagA family TonB-linked outer membrane protein [Chryseobacterium sp. PTM-20240506]|uniref:SusC/RagA family TonB-linked outer membrane protein n=1 Tax=unclassified Chryseobacterium TaxID=2593645 RepID=UPI002358D541|nr:MULTISPECIES: TonB-dependent receptor [unclassified Chryseobacterium]MDC8104853.1 TonB-dependent receptor [Chryseobacterium sp. B21-037]MDQ1805184.1 TonB-dependent receptor [Chryseobacterium sp. CKR4-1]